MYNVQTMEMCFRKCIEQVTTYSCTVRMFLLPRLDFPNVELSQN